MVPWLDFVSLPLWPVGRVIWTSETAVVRVLNASGNCGESVCVSCACAANGSDVAATTAATTAATDTKVLKYMQSPQNRRNSGDQIV